MVEFEGASEPKGSVEVTKIDREVPINPDAPSVEAAVRGHMNGSEHGGMGLKVFLARTSKKDSLRPWAEWDLSICERVAEAIEAGRDWEAELQPDEVARVREIHAVATDFRARLAAEDASPDHNLSEAVKADMVAQGTYVAPGDRER